MRVKLFASLLLLSLIQIQFSQTADAQEDWISMFNGKNLLGWHTNENTDSVRFEDGCIVTNGDRAHVFYVGEAGHAEFKNFEFKCKVKTMPGSNSGIYFHTKFLNEGWPNQGYEAQVNNTQGDPKKTGGLYNVKDNFEAPVKDEQWFDYDIMVQGKHIVIKINDKIITDYTEPDDLNRPERMLSSGTFALQAHDPGSTVYFKDLKVRRLED